MLDACCDWEHDYINPSFVHALNMLAWAQGSAASARWLPGWCKLPSGQPTTYTRGLGFLWTDAPELALEGTALTAFNSFKKALKKNTTKGSGKPACNFGWSLRLKTKSFLTTFLFVCFGGGNTENFYAKKAVAYLWLIVDESAHSKR